MDHGNGTKTYFADGQSKNIHKPTDTIIGSPGNLLSPDRYEFYTFDETGDLVKRLMTLDEIHGLIAGADPESVIADASPTYYHDALSSHSSEALMHLPASDLESLDAPAVHKVLESVQNVLKNEMAANSGKPIPSISSASLNRPESASAWSALFPGLIETPDDVAHLSGYLLPSKTTDTIQKPSTKKPLTSTKTPPTPSQSTTAKPPSSSTKAQFPTTTEHVRSTPKYTTVKPQSTTKFSQTYSTTPKPSTTKKPFRPIQSFDKQKPATQKPNLVLHHTAKPPNMADSLDINKEMSASISDMLSQVTDSQLPNHKPLQTNTLVEKDNTADYVPEESSPELSYYSPVAMSLSTATELKPVTEALTSAKKPPVTVAFKTTTTDIPFSQKTTSTITTTRFGPTKSNVTKPRPPANMTSTSAWTKPPSYNKFNGNTTASSTRNNYQYPPSNMSTKYTQKITQTTQVYPNKLIDHFVKVVNKTINNATLSVKKPTETVLNSTDVIKNKFTKEPNKVFQTKFTSTRPNSINRTNVTLSNRIQELKTTPLPNYNYISSTTTVRSQTEPDKFVSVKVEGWPPMTVQQPTISPSTTPYVSTEKSFFSSNSQPLNAITDANAIRDLISSLMTKPTSASSVSTSTVSSTTLNAEQTLTAAVSTTTPTPIKAITGIPAAMISSTTGAPTTASTTKSTTMMTAAMTATEASTKTTEATTTTTETTTTTTVGTTTTTMMGMIASSTGTSSAAVSSAAVNLAADPVATKTTTAPTTTTTLSSSTSESETQYVPVTHFLPELQVKDKPEAEHNTSTPVVDSMLKDGISAVANMLQNTQKPALLDTEYQEIGERPFEKVVFGDGKESSTEQARKQATVKSDFEETTVMSENVVTQELNEFTMTESATTRYSEPNYTTVVDSVTTKDAEEISRNSEPGLDMLTVFNVSSTGGPMQVAKLADLSGETQVFYETTTPFENHSSNPIVSTTTEDSSTTTTISTTSTTVSSTLADVQNASTPITPDNSTVVIANANSTTPVPTSTTTSYSGIKSPGPSSNAYRPSLANSASPPTVELHPAPHESMGLEASIAFLGDDVRRFADLCNELSFKMWTAVTGKGQIASRSLVLSPFELTAMLAMVFLGARGSTSGQMNDVLRLDDMVTFNPHQVLRNITHSITNVNNPGVATASFVREIYSHKVNKMYFIVN